MISFPRAVVPYYLFFIFGKQTLTWNVNVCIIIVWNNYIYINSFQIKSLKLFLSCFLDHPVLLLLSSGVWVIPRLIPLKKKRKDKSLIWHSHDYLLPCITTEGNFFFNPTFIINLHFLCFAAESIICFCIYCVIFQLDNFNQEANHSVFQI